MRLKKFAVIMFALLALFSVSQRPAHAGGSLYLGSYFFGWHTWVKAIGYHDGWTSPRFPNHSHINLQVYWTPVYGWYWEGAGRKANYHIAIVDGCLYVYNTGSNQEYWRCINWGSWAALHDSISAAVRDIVRNNTGMEISSGWMWWVVYIMMVPALFFAL